MPQQNILIPVDLVENKVIFIIKDISVTLSRVLCMQRCCQSTKVLTGLQGSVLEKGMPRKGSEV